MSDAPAPGPGSAGTPDPDRWWTLGAVCTGIFMLLLDITIVNVALPDIARDLGSSFNDLQWVVDAYALTLAAFLLTSGSLADLFGRRRVFVAGLGTFVVASVLCGLAHTPLLLDLARGLQGVGGAAIFACSLALIAGAFQGRERGTAFGVFGAVTGASVAIGPLVGGALVEGVGWEAIFFVNVPIGAAAIAITLRKVRESSDPGAARLDLPGVALFSLALFGAVFGLVRGNSEGWSSLPIVGALGGGALLLVLFVVLQVRRGEHAMLDLSLFRKPAFIGVSVAAFAISASMFSLFLYLTLYVQNTLGHSPLESGLRFLPITLVSFVVAPITGRLTQRVPTRYLLGLGLTLIGVGQLLFRAVDASSDWTALLPGFLVAGAGIGMTNPAIASTAIAVVEPRRAGMASGINNTFRQVGIATGIAALGALFEHLLSGEVRGVPAQALATGAPSVVPPAAREQFVAAFTHGLDELFLVAAVVSFAGALLALVLTRPRDLQMAGH
ncbi:MFS transporter [Conexibacter sp. SYSU D00693]|uniref:MFS transporter n=1 Tax=Conexibacter sp. SYSU D00693 TaxID=2812560 RepID=UPI00196B9219|nr:MFS transporter [Conexibacter sp. SYSU D00693]